MAKVIGRLRSWRQRFDPNAAFVWRKPTVWDGVEYEVGGLVPDGIRKGKLLYMWNARRIELAMFEQPPGAVPRPQQEEAPGSSNPEPPSSASLPDTEEPASGQAAHQSATSPLPGEEPAKAQTPSGEQSDPSPLPDNVEQRGSWFAVTMDDGTEHRIQGREALDEWLRNA